MPKGAKCNLISLLSCLILLSLCIGCSESKTQYDVGIHWLEQKDNWEMAARSFKRSLEENPKYWKAHAKRIEALAMGEQADLMEKQLRETLNLFSDSARTPTIAEPGMKLLGEDHYNRLAGLYELKYLGSQLARKPTDFTILARCIMAGCRAGDKIAVVDYYKKALWLVGYEGIDDSLLLEMRFFIGRPRMEWLRLDWEIENNPQDVSLRLEQLRNGLILGDSLDVRNKLRKFTLETPSEVDDILLKSFGYLINTEIFKSKDLISGWDASLSPDRRKIVFIQELGNEDYADQYIYQRAVSGGEISPVLKASQHNLQTIAWPVFSPDGKWIYFYGSPDRNWKPGDFGEFRLYRVTLRYGSRPMKLTDSNYINTPLFFTQDGDLLLVRRDISSVRALADIVRFDPESRKLKKISSIREHISGAVFTPSSDSILFTTERGILRRWIGGGKISVDLAWSDMKFPQLSDDGRLLKVINGAGHTLLLDRYSGTLQFLGSFVSSNIAFGKEGEMLVSRESGSQVSVSVLNFRNPLINLAEFRAEIVQ